MPTYSDILKGTLLVSLFFFFMWLFVLMLEWEDGTLPALCKVTINNIPESQTNDR